MEAASCFLTCCWNVFNLDMTSCPGLNSNLQLNGMHHKTLGTVAQLFCPPHSNNAKFKTFLLFMTYKTTDIPIRPSVLFGCTG